MAICPHCGAAVNPGASFCSACGTSLPAPATGAHATSAAPAAGAARARPVGVTIVGVLAMLAGGATAFGGFAAMLFFGALGAGWPFGWMGGLMSAFALIGALFLFGFAALLIATGVGVLRGRNWAWVATIVLAGLNGLQGLAQMAQSRGTGGVITLLVSAAVVVYFFRPEVKAWFGKA